MQKLRLRVGNELRARVCFVPLMLEEGIEPEWESKEEVSQ